ncbi:MAG: hypothetical protein QOE22_21 [Candidatus Parcubacteria bacterium]|jgi:hypothetical protein|nr:hypothetical protein [Candidatus Parcubacteria bacterium]
MTMHKLTGLAFAGILTCAFFVNSIANAQIGVDVGGGVDSSVGGSDAEMGATSESDDAAVSSDESETSDPGTPFSLTRDQAASASIDSAGAELGSDSVSTSDDLSLFATSRMKRDAHIESINASGARVTLEYRKQSRFLGFIPGSIRATAEVTSDGEVSVRYPWYRFLFTVDGAGDVEAALEARAHDIMANANGGFSARAEAELIEAMHVALAGSASADGGTTAYPD